MPKFRPEFQPSYGFLPSSSSLAESFKGWLVDDTMYVAAVAGAGIGPEAYDQIPARMLRPPKDQMEAYEQATYYVALAARRAADLEDDHTKRFLQAQLGRLAKEGEAAQADTNFVCSTTGYWCPVRGSSQVLADTIRTLEDSKLPAEERVRMTTILRASRRTVRLRQAAPWLALLGAGTTAGAYYYIRGRT